MLEFRLSQCIKIRCFLQICSFNGHCFWATHIRRYQNVNPFWVLGGDGLDKTLGLIQKKVTHGPDDFKEQLDLSTADTVRKAEDWKAHQQFVSLSCQHPNYGYTAT